MTATRCYKRAIFYRCVSEFVTAFGSAVFISNFGFIVRNPPYNIITEFQVNIYFYISAAENRKLELTFQCCVIHRLIIKAAHERSPPLTSSYMQIIFYAMGCIPFAKKYSFQQLTSAGTNVLCIISLYIHLLCVQILHYIFYCM